MNTEHNIWEELFTANTMLNKILFNLDFSIALEVITAFLPVFGIMLLGYIIHWLPSKVKDWYRNVFVTAPLYLQIAGSFVTLFVVYQILSAGMQPFIYFQF